MDKIDICVFELEEWVKSRPYAKHIDTNIKYPVFMSNEVAHSLYCNDGKKDDSIGEIHCCIGVISEAIVAHKKKKFDIEYFDNLKIECKIFEHIDDILKKHKIKSISLGNNKYTYNSKDKKFKMKNNINRNN